jgi:hypothetical protein
MRARLAIVGMLLATFVTTTADAQDSSSASPARESRYFEHHGGIRIGIPHLVAIYGGTMKVKDWNMYSAHGHTLTAVLGFGGAQVGIGNGRNGHIGGRRVQLAVLRTWGRPVVADIHQTYAGGEMQILMGAGFAIGAYVRVEGRSDSNRAFLAASFLFGM